MTLREVSSTLPTATDNAYNFDLALFDEVVFEVVLELELTEVDDWVAGAAMVAAVVGSAVLVDVCSGRALLGEPPIPLPLLLLILLAS